MDSFEEKKNFKAEPRYTPAMSPANCARKYDHAKCDVNNFSPVRSPTTGTFPQEVIPPVNFDQETSYPRRCPQPQMPNSELFLQDHATCNVNNFSPVRSPTTGTFPQEVIPPVNFDQETSYPRRCPEPQMPNSELFLQDDATNNVNTVSPLRSPTTGPFSGEVQTLGSPTSLFTPPPVNFDQQTAYPRSHPHQMPDSGLFPQALTRRSISAALSTKMSPSYDPAFLHPIEYQTNPYDNKSYGRENAIAFAAMNVYKPSTNKSRKAASDDDGSKHCNCKKTECVKLYCECFSSGYFCNPEICGCQDCFNTRDYEDTVQEATDKIKSRNPLAFASKGDASNSTPSSEIHRRGCNCKKTRCIKNYCACFENKIGCTNGCSCAGCENKFGKRGDYRNGVQRLSNGSLRQLSGIAFDQKRPQALTQDSLPQTKQYNPSNISSLESPIQFPNLESPASRPDLYSPNGNSSNYYQKYPTTSALQIPTNCSGRLDLQNVDEANSLSREDKVPTFNIHACPIPPNGYLPLSGPQFSQSLPSDRTVELDESRHYKFDNDNNGLLDYSAPLGEVNLSERAPAQQQVGESLVSDPKGYNNNETSY